MGQAVRKNNKAPTKLILPQLPTKNIISTNEERKDILEIDSTIKINNSINNTEIINKINPKNILNSNSYNNIVTIKNKLEEKKLENFDLTLELKKKSQEAEEKYIKIIIREEQFSKKVEDMKNKESLEKEEIKKLGNIGESAKKKEEKVVVEKKILNLHLIKKERLKKIEEEKKPLIKSADKYKLSHKEILEKQRKEIEKFKELKYKRLKYLFTESNEKKKKIIEKNILESKAQKNIKEEELKIPNEFSKHRFRLNLLNNLVNQYLKIYKSNKLENLTKTFEIIHKISEIFQREIECDKKYNQGNLIYVSDAVREEDLSLNFLGLLGEEFRRYGVYSIIEKKSTDPNLMEGVFNILFNSYSLLPKYDIKINSKVLQKRFMKDPEYFFDYIEKYKNKICDYFCIDRAKIFIISKNILTYQFSFLILDREKINLDRYENPLDMEIKIVPLLSYIKLSPDFFDTELNRSAYDWEKINKKIGGEEYIPPMGWVGIGLKVKNKFDNGNNLWLDNKGKKGEWAIAYHGIGKGNEFKKLLNIVLNNLKTGPGQLYQDLPNIRDENYFHIGEGVYLAPDIVEAERYSQEIKLGQRSDKFKFVIMCKVKPDKIRDPGRFPINWIVDDNYNCLRPYRILYKKSIKKN